MNIAARLEQAAPASEILLGERTYRLVRDHVEVEAVEPLELKGKAERVPAYRLVGVRATPSGRGARMPRWSGASEELGAPARRVDDAVDRARRAGS